MKRFLKKTGWFLIPLLLTASVMEVALRQIPNDYSAKREYFEAHAHEIDILILGNSHAYHGVNPGDLPGHAFNAAHVSQTLDLDRKILEKYMDQMDNLHTLIINVSYPSLWGKLKAGSESWRGKYYTIFYGIPTPPRLKSSNLILNQTLRVSLGQIKMYYLEGKDLITISPKGWGGNRPPLNAETRISTGLKAATRHTRSDLYSSQNQIRFNENLDHLHAIIRQCAEHKVHVILFTPPAFHTYRQHLNPDQLHKTINTLQNLSATYPMVDYYNCLTDSTFLPCDFYDADHLSPTGAKKLTEKISTKIPL